MLVISEITGKLAECSIVRGVTLDSGEVVGAMADIDALAMFSVDCRAAIRSINAREGCNLPLPRSGVMLWELLGADDSFGCKVQRGVKARYNDEAAPIVVDTDKETRIQRYADMVAQGIELFPQNEGEQAA
jgi:hypothetical protein